MSGKKKEAATWSARQHKTDKKSCGLCPKGTHLANNTNTLFLLETLSVKAFQKSFEIGIRNATSHISYCDLYICELY